MSVESSSFERQLIDLDPTIERIFRFVNCMWLTCNIHWIKLHIIVLLNVHATILHRTSRVLVNGVYLKKEVVVITDCLDETKDFPEFAWINEIFIMHSSKILLGLMKLHTVSYAEHQRSYVVRKTDNRVVKYFSELSSFQTLLLRPVPFTSGNLMYVTLKYSI